MGSSDGYIFRFDPAASEIENFGKPIRAIEVMGMAFSPLDGKLYGINGGDEEGISRFWCMDPSKGTFEVDYTPVKGFNLKPMADIVCLDGGTVVMAETERIANLWVLTPGRAPIPPQAAAASTPAPSPGPKSLDHPEWFQGHKKLEMEVFPIPSTMHGGSGYTAIQADDSGRIYIGAAYYGKFAPLLQLDPKTAQWRLIFRADELSHQYGRGVGVPARFTPNSASATTGRLRRDEAGLRIPVDIRPDMGESLRENAAGIIPRISSHTIRKRIARRTSDRDSNRTARSASARTRSGASSTA